MTSQPSHMKAVHSAIAKASKKGLPDAGLTSLLTFYAKQLDDLLYEGPMYQATLTTISELKTVPSPALVQLAIKLARDLDRNPDGRNASTAKEYRETIKAITATEVSKAKSFDEQLADILDGK